MRKQILTINDLYTFLVNGSQNLKFESEKLGYEISVSSQGCFEVQDFRDDEGLCYCTVKAFHDLSNANKSFIDTDVFKERVTTMTNRPIMADIVDTDEKDDNGISIKDFSGHTMFYDDEQDKMVYTEIPVGHIINPENIRVEYDSEYDRNFAIADCVIYEEYTDTCNILRRRKKVDCSVELCIRSLSYDALSKELKLDDYYVQGITLLGETYAPGMRGSNVTLADFSTKNNSAYFNNDLINEITTAVLERLSDNTVEFSTDNKNKEVKVALKKKDKNFETEVNATEGVVATETPEVNETFENEEDSDVKTNESVDSDEDVTEKVDADDTSDTEGNKEDFGDDDQEDGSDEETEPTQSVSAIEDEDSTGTKVENSLSYTVTIDGVSKTFAVSLADKINAVTTLVNDTYSEADNTWYYCDVYEDDGKYCVMHDFWDDRHFKQEYSVKKDVYSLKGDRVQVYTQYLTQDEISKLDKMKADYSAIESELNTYKSKELHSQREAILSSDDYSVMKDFAEFNELKSHMDEYSVEDLSKEADLLYAKFMKSKHGTFSSNNNQGNKMVFMNVSEPETEKRQPYGGLFKNFKNK